MNLQENIQRIREMMILVEKTDIKMDDTRVVDLNLTPQKNNPEKF